MPPIGSEAAHATTALTPDARLCRSKNETPKNGLETGARNGASAAADRAQRGFVCADSIRPTPAATRASIILVSDIGCHCRTWSGFGVPLRWPRMPLGHPRLGPCRGRSIFAVLFLMLAAEGRLTGPFP